MIFLLPFLVLLPDILYSIIKSIYFPSVIDIAIYNKDKYIYDLRPVSLGKLVNGKIQEIKEDNVSPKIKKNKSIKASSTSPFINVNADKEAYNEINNKSPMSIQMKREEDYTVFTNIIENKKKKNNNNSIISKINNNIAIPFSARGENY